MNNSDMELTKDRVVKKSLMRAGRKAAVAAGTAVAMAASLITVAPTAQALLTNPGENLAALQWTEVVTSHAKLMGAIRPPSPRAQMIRGDIFSAGRIVVNDGAYLTRSDVYLDRCTTTNASTCTVIASDINNYNPGRFGNIGLSRRIEYTPDYSVDGGKYLRLRVRAVGVDAGRNSESTFSGNFMYLVPRTPQATALPTLTSTLAGTPATEIDASAPFTVTTDPWTLNANGSFDLIGGLYACESDVAGQINTYDWNQTGCQLLSEHESAPGEREFSGDLIKDYVGKYLLAVTVARHKDWSRSGTTQLIQVRSGTYLITKSDTGAQASGNAQQNQGAGQQQNQQNQGAGQQQNQQNQGAGQQQNQGAGQQAFAAAAPTGAAAVRLRTPQAPLVSSTGTGSASGTDLTVRSPAVQKRGKRKKSYRAIVDPQYRGRVAFVLTRTTPKGKMIVAKSRVKNTNKKGRAKIRWKFANKKPPGTYTLYVSFIPKKRYNKPGLTVAKPVQLR